jgi:hypothetical protein
MTLDGRTLALGAGEASARTCHLGSDSRWGPTNKLRSRAISRGLRFSYPGYEREPASD